MNRQKYQQYGFKKIGCIALFGILLLFIVPAGECADTAYLNMGEYVERGFSVNAGDIICGNYETYNSSFLVGVHSFLNDEFINIVSEEYNSGYFEIIIDNPGTVFVQLVNIDWLVSGYIEYTIWKKGDKAIPGYEVFLLIMAVIASVFIIIKNIRKGNNEKEK